MDLRERDDKIGGVMHRHPWELSRTRRVMEVFGKWLDKLPGKDGKRKYINVGAGDLYFDRYLLKKYRKDRVYAVDLEYDESVPDYPRIKKFHYLDEVPDGMDYGIMMDSLEYMPEDAAYVKALSDKIKKGGYLFFTLPAIPAIFSEYDDIVKNLRRYDMKSFRKLVASVPGLKIVDCHYFYTSLFLVRYLQVRLKLRIDKNRNVTSHWKYSEKNWITKLLVCILDCDFMIGRGLSRIGLNLPGLSLLVVCRKETITKGQAMKQR